jgi:hypothetical protein
MKLPTTDRIIKRGGQTNPICKLCYSRPESHGHMIVKCTYAKRVWQKVELWSGEHRGGSAVVPGYSQAYPAILEKQLVDSKYINIYHIVKFQNWYSIQPKQPNRPIFSYRTQLSPPAHHPHPMAQANPFLCWHALLWRPLSVESREAELHPRLPGS